MQDDAADELDVVVAHAERAARRLADDRERLGKEVLEAAGELVLALLLRPELLLGLLALLDREAGGIRLAVADVGRGDAEPLAELRGLRAELVVAELLHLVLERVDLPHHAAVAVDLALEGVAEDLLE